MGKFLTTGIIAISLTVLTPFTAFTQEANSKVEEKLLVTEGFYVKSKMLMIKGPAAAAIWNQMANVEGEHYVDESGRARNIKESNGTFCEQLLFQTRQMATPVVTTICGIVQRQVGN